MKTKIQCAILILLSISISNSIADSTKDWPFQIPCRIQNSTNNDIMIMTLGAVKTPLSQGIFDPLKDQVTLKDGSVKDDYYKNILKIPNYSPIDKSIFPLPPSGWCTWYFYYSHITEDEVKRNAKWIADNLKDYGAQYVQIDDGWQGAGGKQGQRDWSQERLSQFPNGMEYLAKYIKKLGLTAGIWIAPHGQSNPDVIRENPNCFLLKQDGTSASETWEGKYLIDPTTKESEIYLKKLFQKLCDWGFDYFKIDGQPIVVDEYKIKKEFMQNPDNDNVELYRKTLKDIQSVIGQNRYLLGCWGIPTEGIGIMNGSRTGGDIVLGWNDGFMLAMNATLNHYYLHNIAWYNDPDVFVLRSPLTLDQARAWATLQGITGQALMATDRLEDLSDERVNMLKRIYPAVNIRPMDLFPVNNNKHIWDLKVNHLNRNYDVLALFNYYETKNKTIHLKFDDLGLSKNSAVHVFDFWNEDYLGAWEAGMVVDIAPTSCRVLTLMPDSKEIQLISTNRHITQGWVDVKELTYDKNNKSYSGKSKIIKNDPYKLHFAFPKGQNFSISNIIAKNGNKILPAKINNHQGWATVTINSNETCTIDWTIQFQNTEFYPYPIQEPTKLKMTKTADNSVNITWNEQYWLNNGYRLYLNGELLGYTPRAFFPISKLTPGQKYTVEVETTWEDSTVSKNRSKLEFKME